MAEKNKQSKELPTLRLQVPSIILPSTNQSITVLSPAQQQKLGLDITQLISGQQLNLLASHLSGIPTNESSQPVIIVPQAVDNDAEISSASQHNEQDCSTGTSHNIIINIPSSQEHSISITKPIPSTSSTPAGKGRPNKFIALESGEIIRQNTKPPQKQDANKSKKPRGRPKKIVAEEGISKNVDNESDENINNNNKAKSKRNKRQRISDSESDVGDNISKSDTENEVAKAPRLSMPTSNQHSQRPRRSVAMSTRYADYEVEDLPQRPENVWITEKPVEVAEAGLPSTSGNEEVETSSVVVKSKRGRKKGWKLKKTEEMPAGLPIEDNVNCNEEESKDVVSCGACSTKMPRKTYKQHQYKKHNGLAWIEGEDKPIDFRDTTIENQNHLSNLIREAFSRKGGNRTKGGFKNSGKFLSCENCDHRCCSAAGYLSHFRFCQVSDEERLLRMWKCPLCKRMMMPSSRYSHENTHKSAKIGKEEQETDLTDSLFNEKEEKKHRRKAALKAQNTIQETMDQNNPELGVRKDPLQLGFRKPRESNRGIGAVKAAWTRQLESDGKAVCRNMGCNFSSTDLEELQRHHLHECELKPQEVFECLRCTVHCSSESEIINHIATAHPNAHTLSDPEYDGGEISEQLSDYEASSGEEAGINKKRLQPRTTKSSPEKPLPEKGGCNLGMGYSLRFMMPYWTFRNKVPYRPVLKWMLDFSAKNHSENLLFPNLMKLAKLKPLTQPHLYKPDTQFSVSFCTSKKPHPKFDSKFASKQEWTSIPAFSGTNEAEVPLFFTGGPVISLAWCPTLVSQTEDQILAVSTLSSMNVVPKLTKATSDPGLIQLWNCGKMKNITASIKTPHFFMGLGHTWGVIREIAWCPSGCQSPQYYGLLAAACEDGTVKLVPIPKHSDNQLFFHAKCALTLVPHSQQERCPCLRISWYPGKDHGYIAAGFVDGLVCLWKLKNPSQLLFNVDGISDKGDELHPYLKFHAHTGPVTALEVSSIGDGVPRYIFTGSIAEKNMTYWDLEKLGEVSLGNFNRRSRITDATWMTLWPLATSGYEDLQSGTTFIPPRNFCRHFMILPQNSATLSVEKGDWLNGIAQSTVAGEISLMLLNQVIFGMDNEKLQREKRALLTRTCLANLEKTDDCKKEQKENKNASFLTYEQIGQQGIVFCDVALDTDNVWCKDSKSAQLPESMDSSPSVNYPITAINNIAWNPNASSFSWIAAGYQSGFVRILHVKCKSSDQIISSSIQKLREEEEKEENS